MPKISLPKLVWKWLNAGGNVKWYSYSGKHLVVSYETKHIINCYTSQQVYSWAHIPEKLTLCSHTNLMWMFIKVSFIIGKIGNNPVTYSSVGE